MNSTIEAQAENRRVELFRQRFGDGHFHLACHASLSLALTPDLLYRLWANFQRDVQDELLDIPWIAVSDLLLSSLCEEVGEELYEMEDGAREELLKQLRNHPKLGEARLKEVAEFMMAYVKPQLNHPDLDVRDLAEGQHWRSLAYVEPESAARAIALRLAELDHGDRLEWLRMVRLVEPLAEPLAEFGALVDYTRGMAAFLRGRMLESQKYLKKALGTNRNLEIAGVSLPLPKKLRSVLQPEISRIEPKKSLVDFLLENRRWLATGATFVLVVSSGILYWQRSRKSQNITSASSTPSIVPSSSSSPTVSPLSSPKNTVSPTPSVTPSASPSPKVSPSLSPKKSGTSSVNPTSNSKVSPLPDSKAVPSPLPKTNVPSLSSDKNTMKSSSPSPSRPITSPPSPSSSSVNSGQTVTKPPNPQPNREVKTTTPSGNSTVVARDPKGKVTATLEQNQSTMIIRDPVGNPVATLEGASVSATLSPDDNMIATIGLDNTIRLWRIDGQLLKETKNNSKITSLEFTPDSKFLIYKLGGRPDPITMPTE
jgi:hypothetical protein